VRTPWRALLTIGRGRTIAARQRLLNPSGGGDVRPTRVQCQHNAYKRRDFRTRFEAQTAYQACGGRRDDVHRLDEDRDGFACERLP
jgi:hypothetical protein